MTNLMTLVAAVSMAFGGVAYAAGAGAGGGEGEDRSDSAGVAAGASFRPKR